MLKVKIAEWLSRNFKTNLKENYRESKNIDLCDVVFSS